MTEAVRQVVILGGGSAGWLTAGVIAAGRDTAAPPRLQVTLVESPDVNPLGVGEGTWPTMRDTLRRMRVRESAFLLECDASFKQGTKFVDWIGRDGGDYFYHPFVLPQGYGEVDLVAPWLTRHAGVPFADLVSYQPHLCERGCAPKQHTTPEYAAVANYAYHLDAGKFAAFLRKHCTETLGVRHVPDHVRSVQAAADGDIAALLTERHGEVAGDLFVDCSGFASLLLARHYRVPFVSRKDVLFNDAALALRVPYPAGDARIASPTIATAQAGGWIWDIGLPTRRGIGHVYSTAHTAGADPGEALVRYAARVSGRAPESLEAPRRIAFEPGHRERFWHRNCVAVGMAAGFVEPLEASALVLVELSAAMIRDEMPATRAAMDIVARRFNERFRYRWDRIVEFLKLHYLLSGRREGAFWRDHRRPESVPERLRELLLLWRHRPPSRHDFYQVEEVFPSASWQYVLYGMGFRPDELARPGECERDVADGHFRECAAATRKLLAGLPSNRHLIEFVRHHGLPTI